ncbi:ATP-binding cassette long-chain fatty acid transporter pxa1 [Entomophthora muscae]|uniref:ATP-binding cassette long-chain fatty acid transporter pxa1 n=1 Tax=Entomophthora muscae TaxID=34485 RepID=A0ACC2TXC1_9FUNG|nr:ATP-binding cassette long-chain fatty acid transporter pxa1 [Entomophthora muscae]
MRSFWIVIPIFFLPKIERVGVNKQFFSQISALSTILFPKGWWRADTLSFTLIIHTIFLILRTYLSLVVARVDGLLVRDLVSRDSKKFLRSMGYWFAVAVPATYTNSMIRYLQSKLTIGFRTRMIDHCHALYLGNHLTYYKLLNLDRRIEGPDQYISADIARFCDSLAGLYSSLGKPSLDLLIFNYQLSRSIGFKSSIGIMGIYAITVSLLRKISPAFGRLAAVQTQLEGEYRGAHSRLITNAEEIAFYNGGALEKSILEKAYFKLIKHVNSVYKVRISYNMIEDFVIKYCWSAFGLVFSAIPVFKPQWLKKDVTAPRTEAPSANRTQEFITNKRLMLNLGDAGGRIMYSYKELAELAGYTHRVYTLVSTLHALRKNKYVDPIPLKGASINPDAFTLNSIKGQIVYDHDGIVLDRVPIVTPNPTNPAGGDMLVNDLSFTMERGQHLLVTGPNGVGKTGVARVLRGLWPVFRGTLKRPGPNYLFFVPQKPYLSLGNLREQIIYPHTVEEMVSDGRTDADLMKILHDVYLEYIPGREGGFDTIKEWKDVLSGGEKQRLGMARLFYHCPKFAVLDECTSAVSSDVEGLMYNHAKELGITLMTISHRPSLFKYHDHLLSLSGDSSGGYELTGIASDAERHTTLSREIQMIQDKLRDVQQWKDRLSEIKAELQTGNAPVMTSPLSSPSG